MVHHVLPIALAARPFGLLGGAAAVAAMVTRIPRRRGRAPRRRRDRCAGAVARRTRLLPRDGSEHPSAGTIRRTAQVLARGPEAADVVSARHRRRLYDTGL